MRTSIQLLGVLGAAVAVASCEPASITEARDQLARGPARTFTLTIPVAEDTLDISKLIEDTTDLVAVGDLQAVQSDPQSVDVAVGTELKFDNLSFDQFTFGYDQMLRTAQVTTASTVTLAPPALPGPLPAAAQQQAMDTVRFDTPDGSDVVAATVDTGTVVRTLVNNTICDGTITMSLLDSIGNPVASFPNQQVNAGETFTDSVRADGATMSQFVEVDIQGSALGGCTIIPGSSVSADVTFRPMTLASVDLQNVNETFSDTYDPLASETRIQGVDQVVINSGSYTITAQNRLPVALSVSLTLNGILDGAGAPLTGTLNIAAAPGDGSTTTGTLNFNLAGVTIIPSQAMVDISGTATAALATITPTVITNAVVADGTGDLEVESLAGPLDPAVTPELAVTVEESEEITRDDFGLGDFEDAVKGSTINVATAQLDITNTAATPLVLSSFTLGVVELTPAGGIPRDGLGNPVYEVDSQGSPILVDVVDPGQTTLSIARSATTQVTLSVAPLADRLVHLVLDDRRAAIIAAGTATAGDGSQSSIERSDIVGVLLNVAVGLDFTVPDTGVVFTSNANQEGLETDSTLNTSPDEVIEVLVGATATSVVRNNTPFGLEVDVAYVEGDLGDTDVFTQPGAVQLDRITVAAPDLDATGRVIQPVTSTVTVEVTGDELRPLLEKDFTASLRVRLLPGSGAGGRSALRATDNVIFKASVTVQLRSGGGQ